MVGRECLRLARRTLRAAPAERPPVRDRAVEDVVLGRHGDLAAALAGLSLQDREILLLRDVLDRSGDDTAVELGRPRAAMKSRPLRARHRLRRALLD